MTHDLNWSRAHRPENGGDPSAGPGVPRRQVCPKSEGLASFVHLAPLAHAWLLCSLFWEDSVVSGGVLRGAGAGVGLQSFPASGSFQMSWSFVSGGQSIGVSASTSALPMNTARTDLL